MTLGGISMKSHEISQNIGQVLLRFYVIQASVVAAAGAGALRLSLGDGLGSCEALLAGPLLQQLLGQDGWNG